MEADAVMNGGNARFVRGVARVKRDSMIVRKSTEKADRGVVFESREGQDWMVRAGGALDGLERLRFGRRGHGRRRRVWLIGGCDGRFA